MSCLFHGRLLCFIHMQTVFERLVENYNQYAKQKYRRKYWKNLTPEKVRLHNSLREAILNWGLQEHKITSIQKHALENLLNQTESTTSGKKMLKLSKKDMDQIVKLILDGHLIVIPNGKIYVIFGADDDQGTHETIRKINTDKLRHANMPIVKLSSVSAIPYENIKNKKIKEFLDKVISAFQPIGLLVPDKKVNSKSLYVFYGEKFFEELIKKIQIVAKKKIHIFVSSANITTTGANTTAEGVLNDFSSSKYIAAIIDEGDLKKLSKDNNSSTIIECSEKGELAYYRLGYPSEYQLDEFARPYGVKINALPTTRQTSVR